MQSNVIILKPRLDVSFKRSPVPLSRFPLEPIRKYWSDFIELTKVKYEENGSIVEIIEKPLWQFTKKFVNELDADIVYIPHNDKVTFPCKHKNKKIFYYMQMVFPWMFQVDSEGWCAGASVWPIKPKEYFDEKAFNNLKQYNLTGKSKFSQPRIKQYQFGKDFIFFPCQIPHDLTIKLHSQISVEKALIQTIKISKYLKIPLIVKPHPLNPDSMRPLFEIVKKHKNEEIYWIDDININELLNATKAVFTINSGVGMEAILYNKPVFTFGKAEYAAVSIFIDRINIDWVNREKYIKDYPAFIDAYVSNMVEVPDRY